MWGEIISGVANLGGSILNNAMNARNAREANEANKQAATTAYQRQVDFWNMQNQYNDPSQAVARLIKAGVNPNAVYGNMQNSASSLSSIPQQSSAIPAQFGIDTERILQSLLLKKQADNLDANTKNTLADAHKKETEANLNDANLQLSQQEYENALYKYREVLPRESQLLDRQIETIDLNNLWTEIIKNNENKNLEQDVLMKRAQYREFIEFKPLREALLKAQEKESISRAVLNYAQAHKLNAETEVVKEQLKIAQEMHDVRIKTEKIGLKLNEQQLTREVWELIDAKNWSKLNMVLKKFYAGLAMQANNRDEKRLKLQEREVDLKEAAVWISGISTVANFFGGSGSLDLSSIMMAGGSSGSSVAASGASSAAYLGY